MGITSGQTVSFLIQAIGSTMSRKIFGALQGLTRIQAGSAALFKRHLSNPFYPSMLQEEYFHARNPISAWMSRSTFQAFPTLLVHPNSHSAVRCFFVVAEPAFLAHRAVGATMTRRERVTKREDRRSNKNTGSFLHLCAIQT